MRKFWTALLAVMLILPMLFQSQAQAAINFTILIDGVKLTTSQAPVMIQGRVMLPMRAIFEALDAKVTWNQKAQTVTAVKDRTTIVLKINAKTATINKQTVYLDVPAKVIKNTTMVPVRFVSESLGEKVGWNSKTKTVTIKTSDHSVPAPDNSLYPVSYVTLRDIGNNGDGRDLQVSFSKSATESRAAQYRVMVVKSSKTSSFNLSTAQLVPSSNFTVVYPSGSDPSVTLTSNSRDVDGEYIRQGQAYTSYVLAVGKIAGEVVLSSPSPSLTLVNTNAVESATNVKGNDVSDYNDGRDLSVSFTRAKNESNISSYRVIAVKTKDIGWFDLAAAKSVASQNYTTVNKTSSSSTTLSTVLSSSSRDSSGEYIRNGIPYTLYVLSVSSNENTAASRLSSGSSSITLATGSTAAPVITQITDISDYGDGRDLRVSFTKLSDESGIGAYRIFVVKSSDYKNFSLSKANNVSSYNYTQVNKTGNNITQALSSGARDVDGATIRNGVYYRVFVMSVATGNNSGNNKLSNPSNDIILYNNTASVGSVSNLYITDVSDYNDGRDLQVSFTRASDESNINHYRAFVVKTSKANNFDLNDANSLSSSRYTQISKTGYNISKVLNSSSRDTDGDYIRNGVSYRVFIMSAANSNYSGNNALSSYSSTITLGNNRYVTPVTSVGASDVSDYGDGRDLKVSFTKASDESNIGSYRAFVVKAKNASNFDLDKANNLSSYYYTQISKTGSNISQILKSSSVDTDGDLIENNMEYRVFIMSVGSGNYSGSNALSSYSPVIKLGTNLTLRAATITEVKDISDNGNGSDLQVKFNSSPDYSNISEYRILVVKADRVANFDPTKASNYTVVRDSSSAITKILESDAKDVDGNKIIEGTAYYVFVSAIGKGDYAGKTALSNRSDKITLTNTKVDPVTNVTVTDLGPKNDNRLRVSFDKASNDSKIDLYRIIFVKQSDKDDFTLASANGVKEGNYITVDKDKTKDKIIPADARDFKGNPIAVKSSYVVYVLSVSKDGKESNALSAPSSPITLKGASVTPPLNVTAKVDDEAKGFEVTFQSSNNTENLKEYRVMAVPVPSTGMQPFGLEEANKVASNSYKEIDPKENDLKANFALGTNDVNKTPLTKNTQYIFYVLAVNNGDGYGGNELSSASSVIVIKGPETETNPESPSAASNIEVKPATDGKNLEISFKPAADASKISSYQLLVLPSDKADSFNLKKAFPSKSTLFKRNTVTPLLLSDLTKHKPAEGKRETRDNKEADVNIKHVIEIPAKDGNGETILAGKEYKFIILSVVKKSEFFSEVVAMSKPSKPITLVAEVKDTETTNSK
ncbi:copper amine oxidase N-terminal domain-containing protein [Paenibacillus dakarensis]|uniref:copper amine oxidase N-terminal domain-containing protein n=1 Tax=Paenibacillus dakarensis TaxID=1527293 RepID=UPI0009E8FC32|nr:copper amine oxidase N-terminal domain-containing protein [Paenibacillus dakarensis]